ncbi:MAG: RdgB/HAM1 family non-canonical purine NTP pyrophosphatase [Actinomycetota bacterium]|nr:RdgB/HAM1 family non-canonical purine NTP pyrophosphatase [Actinomycetota bacterium]
MTVFVLASANPDKVAEIRAILGPSVELRSRPASVGEVEETGCTLEENARIKARALVDATGMAAIADDTGLEVDALDGAPGVYSARFSGAGATYASNVAKLLESLRGRPDRGARFRTVALALWPDGRELVAEGWVRGVITTEGRGADGFGYDPVFQPDGAERTFAEMTTEEKNVLSHRGRAFRSLADRLAAR